HRTFLFSLTRRPPIPTPFPYTTLFRSVRGIIAPPAAQAAGARVRLTPEAGPLEETRGKRTLPGRAVHPWRSLSGTREALELSAPRGVGIAARRGGLAAAIALEHLPRQALPRLRVERRPALEELRDNLRARGIEVSRPGCGGGRGAGKPRLL